MTEASQALSPDGVDKTTGEQSKSSGPPDLRKRWLSRRALILHLEVVIVAPGCAIAGWWQATRALAGNGLSWFYSVEWPIFALLAIWGWWHLIHEDPEELRARKAGPIRAGHTVVAESAVVEASQPASAGDALTPATRRRSRHADGATVALSRGLGALILAQFAIGILTLVELPVGRPAGFLPSKDQTLYIAHATLGALAFVAAALLLLRVRGSVKAYQMVAWMGFVGMAIAGVGGLLVAATSLVRFFGITLMFIGPLTAAIGYLVPAVDRMPREQEASPAGGS